MTGEELFTRLRGAFALTNANVLGAAWDDCSPAFRRAYDLLAAELDADTAGPRRLSVEGRGAFIARELGPATIMDPVTISDSRAVAHRIAQALEVAEAAL